MARYRRYVRTDRRRSRRKAKISMGKKFVTKRGRYGCYKYVNGRRVSFIEHKRAKKYRRK